MPGKRQLAHCTVSPIRTRYYPTSRDSHPELIAEVNSSPSGPRRHAKRGWRAIRSLQPIEAEEVPTRGTADRRLRLQHAGERNITLEGIRGRRFRYRGRRLTALLLCAAECWKYHLTDDFADTPIYALFYTRRQEPSDFSKMASMRKPTSARISTR